MTLFGKQLILTQIEKKTFYVSIEASRGVSASVKLSTTSMDLNRRRITLPTRVWNLSVWAVRSMMPSIPMHTMTQKVNSFKVCLGRRGILSNLFSMDFLGQNYILKSKFYLYLSSKRQTEDYRIDKQTCI